MQSRAKYMTTVSHIMTAMNKNKSREQRKASTAKRLPPATVYLPFDS